MARGHFAKSEKQAASVMKEMQGKNIASVGTVRNYEQALKTCCDFLKEHKLGALRELTPEITKQYLEIRAAECSQKTVDMDRQAIQAMMQHV
jgi:site-specific recombinase XerD